MKLKNLVLVLVNAAIVAGLIVQYFRGRPVFSLVVTGALMLAMVNLVFFIRLPWTRNLQ